MSRPIELETFSVDSKFVVLFRICAWISASFAVFFVCLPSIFDFAGQAKPFSLFVLSGLGFLFFGCLAVYSFYLLKQLPCSSITIDSEGLWPSHESKENGLVRWSSITDVKEHPTLQRLDVTNATGDILLRIEYQLMGFDRLRDLIINHLPSIQHSLIKPETFSKPVIYHIFNVAALIGFSWLGLKVGTTSPLLGYGAMACLVAIIGREYVMTACSVTIAPGHLIIRYPCRHRRYSYTQVESVKLGDSFVEGMRLPEVDVFLKGRKKPIKLPQFGTNSTKLYQFLSNQTSRSS